MGACLSPEDSSSKTLPTAGTPRPLGTCLVCFWSHPSQGGRGPRCPKTKVPEVVAG